MIIVTRGRWILDPDTGKLVNAAKYHAAQAARKDRNENYNVQVIAGFDPVVSPVDGTILDSPQAVREHNKRNGVVDIGDDAKYRDGTHEKVDTIDDGDMYSYMNHVWDAASRTKDGSVPDSLKKTAKAETMTGEVVDL